MTTQQEQHLASIKASFSVLVDGKYRKGQAEHGGDLFTVDLSRLVDFALDEAIDQVVYLLTIKETLCLETERELVGKSSSASQHESSGALPEKP